MNRIVKQIPANEREFRYEVTIEGLPSGAHGQEGRASQLELLRSCLSTHGMLDCGGNTAQKLRMFHDGEKWVIVLEATGP